MRELLSLRGYAKHRGCTLSAVQKAIEKGRITTVADGNGNTKIDPGVADIQWAQNTNALQQERGGLLQFEKSQALLAAHAADQLPLANEKQVGVQTSVQTPGLSAEKAGTEAVRRKLLEIQLAQKRGELVSVEDVSRAMANKLKAAQEYLNSMADRLAPLLAAETNVDEVDRMLREELRRAMNQIAQEAPAVTQ
jgi:hypothetical protein